MTMTTAAAKLGGGEIV